MIQNFMFILMSPLSSTDQIGNRAIINVLIMCSVYFIKQQKRWHLGEAWVEKKKIIFLLQKFGSHITYYRLSLSECERKQWLNYSFLITSSKVFSWALMMLRRWATWSTCFAMSVQANSEELPLLFLAKGTQRVDLINCSANLWRS